MPRFSTPVDPVDLTPVPRPEPSPRPPALPCGNCGTPLGGPYCSQCGQHTRDYHRSVWRFLQDFFDNTFCWDNKLLLTVKPLLRQPGSLTREFMLGRRVRYVHPLRLFLFTSAVCLALIGFIHHHTGGNTFKSKVNRSAMVQNTLRAEARAKTEAERKAHAKAVSASAPVQANAAAVRSENEEEEDDDERPATRGDDRHPAIGGAAVASSSPAPGSSPTGSVAPAPESFAAKIQQVLVASAHPTAAPEATIAPSPSTGTPLPAGAASTPSSLPLPGVGSPEDLGSQISQLLKENIPENAGLPPEAQKQLESLEKIEIPKINQVVDAISEGVENRLSWVALALLPVFALFVRATYWRRDSYYFEHLVFSLHYHTFLFIFWAAYVLASILIAYLPFRAGWNGLLVCCLPLPAWYLYASLRRMYGESRRRTLAKTALISTLHLLSILIGVSVVGALAFFSMPK